MRWLTVLGLAVATACGGTEQGVTAQKDDQSDTAQVAIPAPLTMPAPPQPRSGHLVTVAAGDSTLTGAWPARAGRCPGGERIHVATDPANPAIMILVHVSDSQPSSSPYPVLHGDSTAPVPGARIGVHRLHDRQVSAWKGTTGTVELSQLGRRASGLFRAEIEEISNRQIVYLAGAFADLTVEPLSATQCRTASERDSTTGADTTGSADTP